MVGVVKFIFLFHQRYGMKTMCQNCLFIACQNTCPMILKRNHEGYMNIFCNAIPYVCDGNMHIAF